MRQTSRWVQFFAIVAVGALGLPATSLSGEVWPQRPVRFVVPVSAGTGTDVSARLIADRLAERWKQPVIVENRPGADGLVGTVAFAGMHDDHTLLYSFAAPVSVLPILHEKLPYDPVRDLVPIAQSTDTFITVAASATTNIHSLAELVDRARSQPGKLNYNAGAGALPYVFAGFLKKLDLSMILVSYRDTALPVQDLGEGRIQIMMAPITMMQAQANAGKVRLIALTNQRRSPTADMTPTAREAGYPEIGFEGLAGFFGPRGLSTELRDRISADVRAVAALPALADRLASVGQVAHGSTPAEFAAAVEEQRAQMESIVKLVGNKLAQ